MCARTASVAVAGYYPTPTEQIPRIAGLLTLAPMVTRERGYVEQRTFSVLDPCAGDGEAIEAIATALLRAEGPAQDTVYYTCEMEASRHEALEHRFRMHYNNQKRALGGDAFLATWAPLGSGYTESNGVGLLFLNPPYDTDKVHGRLEQRFLDRFSAALCDGGILVFVVPHYALAASADTLGKCYEDLSCYKFAGAGFDVYKQIVLFAKRRSIDLYDADPEIVAKVEAWASDAADIPEIPEEGTASAYTIPVHTGEALRDWKLNEIDVAALVGKFAPWCETTRAKGLAPVARILPDLPVAELMHRVYEVATPPRPAHIAAGIAAGIFNGQRITPDDPKATLPPLLVKGVFDREWRTVEEKKNKDGDTTGEVQVQQPKLVVTILDLDKHKYHTVKASIEADRGGVPAVEDLGVADLLKHYGQALMGVMEKQCAILYDPRKPSAIEMPESPRRLYDAQGHAVRACVTLLKERPGRQPVLLGEIGSGKTGVALMAGKAMGKKCFLVLCPPHLLDSWRNEVRAVMPEAIFTVIESLSDVDAIAGTGTDETVVAVLSRETAKLGHGWIGAGEICPKCGLPAGGRDEQAKKRLCCEQKTLSPVNRYAKLAKQMALYLRGYKRTGPVRNILRGRLDYKWAQRLSVGEEGLTGAAREQSYKGLPEDFLWKLRYDLAWDYVNGSRGDDVKQAIVWLYAMAPDPDFFAKFLMLAHDPDASSWQNFVECAVGLLPEGPARDAVLVCAVNWPKKHWESESPLTRIKARLAEPGRDSTGGVEFIWKDGELLVDGIKAGSLAAATRALEALAKLATWKWSEECGEPLHQAVPEPRRYPLAKYILRRHRGLFDFLILDEGHEYANGDSAQGLAAHRLTTLRLPTIFMTGSVMNGYATSLFANMWALSPEFREEFERGDIIAFNDRYGYRKRVVQDKVEGEVVAFGSQTDRVERSERDVGNAPGVLPLFLFRHLLPSAVTIHKSDLRIDLPRCDMAASEIDPSAELEAEYKRLLKALTEQIRKDRFVEGRAGKLFGALAEMPSYLDRATADVGNGEGGAYEIRYPESVGGELIATGKMFPASMILPKEKWLLDRVEGELAEGRNVMVFGWHLGLLPRLARLIEERTGEAAPILYADKVPTAKRQAWIEREIVKKKRRVMVANPVCIQTGLNNLVHFSTEIWHENPACNPIVYRQAIGRIDRIGQKLETRVAFGYYGETLQQQLYELLIAKVAISTATDGLDPESALRAAGIVEDEFLTGLSIGKQLWAMLTAESEDEERAPRKRAVGGKR